MLSAKTRMLSAKTEYACVALARLAAEHAAGAPVQARRLASDEGIPEGFLVQILQELKRVGLVSSTRGANGGYRLARDPSRLSLGEVIELLEGAPDGASNLTKPSPIGEALAAAVRQSADAQRERLHAVSLAELASAAGAAQMYYI